MKVGGNESATKYFQSHGGTAALASKDPKTKYTSNAATKYKEELTRRVAADATKYPEEVVITDIPDAPESNGTNTPAEPADDDFFSSWDKPTIKRPSNPPSRVGTPSQAGKTASPYLNPGANGSAPGRPKSPLAPGETGEEKKPTTAKPVAAAAVRKTATGAAGAKPKANILGGKKKGLGAKKVTTTEDVDFEEAEKKAKEEQERIEKLGYNPDETAPPTPAKESTNAAPAPQIASPQPVNAASHHRASSDVDRLGMGVTRLGFGQMKGQKGAAGGAKKPAGFGGFGAVGRAPEPDTDKTARDKFGTQKGISSDEFFGRGQFDANAQNEAKSRLQGFEGATSISSNAYFGRPEEEQGEDYGDLEGAARDFVRKFGITAGDDLGESFAGFYDENVANGVVQRMSRSCLARVLIGYKVY